MSTPQKQLYDFYTEGRRNGIKRWEGTSPLQRKYSLAKASYTRMKRRDPSRALLWLQTKFGPSTAKSLLESWNF